MSRYGRTKHFSYYGRKKHCPNYGRKKHCPDIGRKKHCLDYGKRSIVLIIEDVLPGLWKKEAFVSPSAMIAMWRYRFRLSRYVYGGNRSFAPILRQNRWSLLCDVYWLVLMMMNRCTWTGTMGSKYLNTVQDQNCSFFFWTTNNQRIYENETNNNEKNYPTTKKTN